MCGLWGALGTLGKLEDDGFTKQACQVGALRGDHATGVLEITDRSNKIYYHVTKAAISGAEFAAKESKALVTYSGTRAILGHNRYATSTLRDDEHAHPFQEGDVILMHNGVVDNTEELRKKYELNLPSACVDSRVLAAALSVGGPKEVLETFRGAMALVWFDLRGCKVYFARNEERPLYFAVCKDKFFYASEKGMLTWLLERNKIAYIEIKELTVGDLLEVQIIPGEKLNLSTTKFTAAKRVRTPLYDSDWGAGYGTYNYSSSSASANNQRTYSGTTNPEGLTYNETLAEVKRRLSALGVAENKEELWVLKNVLDQASNTIKLEYELLRSPHCAASTYLYRPASVRSGDDCAKEELYSIISSAGGAKFKESVGYASAVVASIYLNTSWSHYEVADIVTRGLYSITLLPSSVTFYDEDTEVIWDYAAAAQGWANAEDFKSTGFINGQKYQIKAEGINKNMWIKWFVKDPMAIYRGVSAADKNSVVVSPNSAPNVSFTVPKTCVIGGVQ